MAADLRVCVVGDSFVAGVGDPDHLGWVGRIAARTHRGGRPLTVYALGVRRETSRDVLARWHRECAPRLPDGSACRLVVSFGVNDTTDEGGGPRVPPAESCRHLGALLDGAGRAQWPAFVVGPVPIDDRLQNARTKDLDREFERLCRAGGVAYVSVFDGLSPSRAWMAEVAGGDGAHPWRGRLPGARRPDLAGLVALVGRSLVLVLPSQS